MQQLHIERNPIHLKLDDSLQVSCSDSPLARVAPSVLAQVHTWYSTVQYSTVQYSTVQYSTVQYSTDLAKLLLTLLLARSALPHIPGIELSTQLHKEGL